MRGFARLVERPARWLAWLSALLILAMSFWITYDVVTRNLFDWASPWAFDLSEYSLVWMTFLAAPWILLRDGHVRVEILIDALRPRPQRAIGIAVSVIGLIGLRDPRLAHRDRARSNTPRTTCAWGGSGTSRASTPMSRCRSAASALTLAFLARLLTYLGERDPEAALKAAGGQGDRPLGGA